MDEKDVLEFIRRIIRNAGTRQRARDNLIQLAEIMRHQGVDKKLVDIVEAAADTWPELSEEKKSSLDDRSIRIAIQRGQERIRREMEEARQGRC